MRYMAEYVSKSGKMVSKYYEDGINEVRRTVVREIKKKNYKSAVIWKEDKMGSYPIAMIGFRQSISKWVWISNMDGTYIISPNGNIRKL